jgi:Cu2+-exporting ATPase
VDTEASEGGVLRDEALAGVDGRGCRHCGSPVPPGRDSQFCCAGCAAVFQTISNLGLERYYKLKAAEGATRTQPVQSIRNEFRIFDDPIFTARYSTPVPHSTELRSAVFYLEGIHCAACVWILERLPTLDGGILNARVEFGRSIVTCDFDPTLTSLSRIASLINSLGYRPSPFREEQEEGLKRAANRVALIRIGVAALCAMNVMMLSVSIYQGQRSGIEESYLQLFSWGSLALTLPVLFFSAVPFYRTALGGLKSGVLHIDLPIMVAVLAAFGFSAFNTFTGGNLVYYDSVCALVLLLLAGRWIQHRTVERLLSASQLLYAVAPRAATVASSGEQRFVESLPVGEVVRVEATEVIPVDGVVTAGSGELDNGILTGESVPVPLPTGARVFTGARLVAGTIEIRVEACGAASRLGRLMKHLESASAQRAPLELFLDRVSKGFIAVVLVLAAATFWWWSVNAGVARGFETAIALLVVSCPCVLAIATPLTLSLSLASAAKRGILIKNPETIERLLRLKRLLLDKTGTLTTGKMAVLAIRFRDESGKWRAASNFEDPQASRLIAVAQALEAGSYHPIASAVRALPRTDDTAVTEELESEPGIGVRARVSGEIWSLRTPRGLPLIDSELAAVRSEFEDRGASEAVLCRGETPQAIFLCADEVRPECAKVISDLSTERGLKVEILSGDRESIAFAVGGKIGVSSQHIRGDLTPEEKASIACAREAECPTAFVGDGVNDAAALKSCSVGIAVHGGAEVSLAVADVYLSAPGLLPLKELLDGATRTMRTIKVSLWISATYNVVGVIGAMAGVIGPLHAAILMPLSSLSTIGVALLSRKFERPDGAV